LIPRPAPVAGAVVVPRPLVPAARAGGPGAVAVIVPIPVEAAAVAVVRGGPGLDPEDADLVPVPALALVAGFARLVLTLAHDPGQFRHRGRRDLLVGQLHTPGARLLGQHRPGQGTAVARLLACALDLVGRNHLDHRVEAGAGLGGGVQQAGLHGLDHRVVAGCRPRPGPGDDADGQDWVRHTRPGPNPGAPDLAGTSKGGACGEGIAQGRGGRVPPGPGPAGPAGAGRLLRRRRLFRRNGGEGAQVLQGRHQGANRLGYRHALEVHGPQPRLAVGVAGPRAHHAVVGVDFKNDGGID